jgi:hypothetical protein
VRIGVAADSHFGELRTATERQARGAAGEALGAAPDRLARRSARLPNVPGFLRSPTFLRILLGYDAVVTVGALVAGAVSLTRPLPTGAWVGFAIALAVAGTLTGAVFLSETSERREPPPGP